MVGFMSYGCMFVLCARENGFVFCRVLTEKLNFEKPVFFIIAGLTLKMTLWGYPIDGIYSAILSKHRKTYLKGAEKRWL